MRSSLAIVASFLTAALACDSADERGSIAPQSASDWPVAVRPTAGARQRYERIVLVTLDTLRADHVSCYGYPRRTTPFLDGLAARGVRFTRAIAAVSQTAPSHATMLTGLVPAVHGVIQNGESLDPRTLDLAETFRAAGYATAAFLNAKFLAGVAQSFDTVEVLALGGKNGRSRLSSRDVVDAALAWLARNDAARPFFLWVHMYDPHHWKDGAESPAAPLWQGESPEGFFERLLALHGLPEPRPGEPYRVDWNPEYEASSVELEAESAEGFLRCIDAYDALIRFADSQLQRLYEGLARACPDGRTMWVVTSDHGEGLASHGATGHGGRIYQEQLAVPLVLQASDDSLAPRIVDELVAHVDLFATLAETLGTEVAGVPGLYDGRSLWPLLAGEGTWEPRQLFSQRRPATDSDPNQVRMYALQDRHRKYILHEPGEDEFFELDRDPRELSAGNTEAREAAALRAALEQRLRAYDGLATGARQSVPEEWLEELRDLGYVR